MDIYIDQCDDEKDLQNNSGSIEFAGTWLTYAENHRA